MVSVFKAAVVFALLLQLVACSPWTRTPMGSHSLRYCATVMMRPGLREPRIIVVGKIDDTPFVRLDTDHQVSSPALKQEELKFCEQQILLVKTQARLSGRNLMTLVRLYNKSMDDSHTLHWMQGCDVGPDGRLLLWLDQFEYESMDLLTLNQDPSSWTAGTNTVPEISQHKLEAYLKDNCSELVQKYLERGKERLLCSDSPGANVTCHPRSESEVTMRCWAQGFYPADRTQTRLLNEENLTQEMELVENRPAGDRTFQKWATVVVPLGKEKNYTCHVKHERLPEPLTQTGGILGVVCIIAVVCIVAVASIVAVVVFVRRRNRGGKGGDYAPAGDSKSIQSSDLLLQA